MEEALEAKKAAKASKSFVDFCEFVIKDEKTGEKIKLSEIHKTWIDHVGFCQQNGLHALILAPMGHGKTQIMSIAMPLYLLGRDPKSRMKLVCLSDESAKERLVAIKSYIEEDDDLKKVFPHLKKGNKDWSKHKITVDTKGVDDFSSISKDTSVDAKGVTSGGIGGRCDYLLVDDIFDYRTAIAQPTMRQQIIDTYKIVWLTRLEPGNNAIIICTRWHQKDLAGYVMDDPELRSRYGILIQAVSPEYDHMDARVIIPDEYADAYQKHIGGYERVA